MTKISNWFKNLFSTHTKFEFIFGFSRKGNFDVSYAEWLAFCKDYITFSGYTEIYGCVGKWNGQGENVAYITHVCENKDVESTREKVSKICTQYNSQFDQDCVMVIESKCRVNYEAE